MRTFLALAALVLICSCKEAEPAAADVPDTAGEVVPLADAVTPVDATTQADVATPSDATNTQD